ncbi:MAG: DUF3159 domain-containing protein [Egibacteraceae bacterium]
MDPSLDDVPHDHDPLREPTVEAEVRARLSAELGGLRGALEAALPFAVFSLAYVTSGELRAALLLGVGSAVVLFALRLAQRTSTRFARNGVVGIAVAAVIAMATGSPEAAFLPGIIQSAAWAVGLGASILLRRPAVGYLIGAVLDDPAGWRDDPAIVRLANRLTFVLLLPMVVRVAVQYPLYLAGEVGWLGAARVALGWPLYVAALVAAGALLARGRTPLHRDQQPGGTT